MRITNQMMANSMLTNLNASRARSATLMDQLTSGHRITKVSEDLSAGGQVMRVQSSLKALEQWTANIHDAQDWVKANEVALDEIHGLLLRAKEVALQGANSTVDDNARKTTLAAQAQGIYEELTAALNQQGPDGFLFGGFKTSAPPPVPPALPYAPFDTSGPTPTYQGDSGNIQRDLGPGITMTVNIHGGQFYPPPVPPPAVTPPDPLTAVHNLVQNLKAGSPTPLQGDVGSLENAMKLVLDLRTVNGTRMQRLEQLESQAKERYISLEGALEQAQGVDAAKAILELNNEDTTYRAALQVGARIIPQTLVDFLR